MGELEPNQPHLALCLSSGHREDNAVVAISHDVPNATRLDAGATYRVAFVFRSEMNEESHLSRLTEGFYDTASLRSQQVIALQNSLPKRNDVAKEAVSTA